jgi:hypothetical protein
LVSGRQTGLNLLDFRYIMGAEPESVGHHGTATQCVPTEIAQLVVIPVQNVFLGDVGFEARTHSRVWDTPDPTLVVNNAVVFNQRITPDGP